MLALIQKNQVLITSFLSVLVSLYLLIVASTGQLRRDPVGPLVLELMRPFAALVQGALNTTRGLTAQYRELTGALAENQRLKARILELEAERQRLYEAQATARRLQGLLELREQIPDKTVAANVIAGSASTWFQSLTLDKGADDGIEKGMAVVAAAGVLGQIVAVSARTAKVLLVTDSHSAVDVVCQRSRARGIVSGSLEGPIVKYVKRSEDLKPGDRLITSGLDGVFPKGMLVGHVEKVQKKGQGLFQQVTVTLAVDPRKVEEALIVIPGGRPS
ncbi:MAG TPA: rod shape-determining protein MreC [Candidatus Acidoferrales bacterium]|nr:rod shape-determining protein MreC [Candidatus Acidoferrales bacterium]